MASRAFSRNFLVGSVVVCVLLFTKAAVPPSRELSREQKSRPGLLIPSLELLLPRRSRSSLQTHRTGSYRPYRSLLESNQSRTDEGVTSAASNATHYRSHSDEQPGTSELRSGHVTCPAASQPTRDGQCAYVREHPECQSDSELGYATFFFCTCQSFRILGFIVLVTWLACLFFMLGNTAADYFCPALEELSSILRLPPTVAGVTLLPLGNGAPDVFPGTAEDEWEGRSLAKVLVELQFGQWAPVVDLKRKSGTQFVLAHGVSGTASALCRQKVQKTAVLLQTPFLPCLLCLWT